jgi:hypothetical protein
MIHAALSSMAFAGLSSEAFLSTARDAGFLAVEWSADGFLEPGNVEKAGNLMLATLHAGLSTAAYTVPFRVGSDDPTAFWSILETAKALYTPVLRLLASGHTDSTTSDEARFCETALRLADAAGQAGITLCLGMAEGSLLDSLENVIRLFGRLDHPFLKLSWEPVAELPFDTLMETFSTLSGRIGLLVARTTAMDGRCINLVRTEEEWIEFIDAYDEQAGSPDMVRHVVIRALECQAGLLSNGCDGAISEAGSVRETMPGDPGASAAKDAECFQEWNRLLRLHHRRRVY